MRKKSDKPYVQRTFTLSLDLVEKLNQYSDTTGVARSFTVSQALQEYLGKRMEKDENYE